MTDKLGLRRLCSAGLYGRLAPLHIPAGDEPPRYGITLNFLNIKVAKLLFIVNYLITNQVSSALYRHYAGKGVDISLLNFLVLMP